MFQDTIPQSVAIFKDDKSFHWGNKSYKDFNFSEVSLDELLKNFDLNLSDLATEKNTMLSRSVSYEGDELNVSFRKSTVNDDVYYIFYGSVVSSSERSDSENEFEKLIEILEHEKSFSSVSDNMSAAELAHIIIDNKKNHTEDNEFQHQLEDLENQVVDFHKMNTDISKFCRDLDVLNRDIHSRNEKISRNLLKIITNKEDLEKVKELQTHKLVAAKEYNSTLMNSIEGLVKDVYELNDLAKNNEISYGQLKNELESIYNTLANIELPNENLYEANLGDSDNEQSIDSEIIIADLLNEHFKSTDDLILKLGAINQMLVSGNDINDYEESNKSTQVLS